MHIRCPHCQNPIEVVQEADLSDVSCPSCGSHFSLVANTASTVAQQVREKEIGHFTLKRRLGLGAFGEVWQAHDSQLDRDVAIKVPRLLDLNAEASEKFFREARAAAQLQHPNIVSIHEVGRHESQIYIVSDYIDGITIADRLSKGPLGAREATELAHKVATALHYAHEQGVVHRDLKPSNIMLDSADEPHIMDFGLAKRDAGEITVTVDGQLLGTPAYMSPEQARGSGHNANRRSDVYSLGVVLFEMLTGERPFRGNSRMLIHQVIRDEPPAPRRLNSSVPLDVETITLKCMEKDPQRRYTTAQELANDLRRWMDHEPIVARPTGRVTRGRKWMRRHPTAAAVLGVSIVALACLLGGGLWYQTQLSLALTDAESARERADEERDNAIAVGKENLRLAEEKSQALENEQLIRRTAEERLAEAYLEKGRGLCGSGNVALGLHWFGRSIATLPADSLDLRQAALMNLALWHSNSLSLQSVMDHGSQVTVLQYSRDGTKLLTASFDRTARLWSVTTGKPLGPELEHPHQVEAAALATDGQTVVTGCYDGSVRIFNGVSGELLADPIETGTLVREVRLTDNDNLAIARNNSGKLLLIDVNAGQPAESQLPDDVVYSAFALSPDGDRLATSTSKPPSLTLWNLQDLDEGSQPLTVEAGIRRMEFSSDGQWLATVTSESVLIWQLKKLDGPASTVPHRGVSDIAFSQDESLIATASYGGQVAIWKVASAGLVGRPLSHPGQVSAVEFIPNSSLLLTSSNRIARLWDYQNSRSVGQPLRDSGLIAVSPNGMTLTTGSVDKAVRIWQFHASRVRERLLHNEDLVLVAAFSPDGELVATGGQDKAVRLWSTQSGQQLGETIQRDDVVSALQFSPTNRHVAIGTWDGVVQVYDSGSARSVGEAMKHDGQVTALVFSSDGSQVVTAGHDAAVRFWQTETGKPLREPLEFETIVTAIDLHSESRTLAVANFEGPVSVIDTVTSEVRYELSCDAKATIQHVDINRQGTQILTATNRGTLQLWNAASGEPMGEPMQHQKGLTTARFSQDGTRILSSSWDQTARVWDCESQLPRGPVLRHEAAVIAAALSPDTTMMLTGGDDNTTRLWHVARGIQLGPAIDHAGEVSVVAFRSDAQQFLCGHGTTRLLELPNWGSDAQSIRDWLTLQTGIECADDGAVTVLDGSTWQSLRQRVPRESDIGATNSSQPIGDILRSTTVENGPYSKIHRSFNPRPQRKDEKGDPKRVILSGSP